MSSAAVAFAPVEMLSPTRRVWSRDGVPIAVYDQPGDVSLSVLLAHATGFCAQTWAPVTKQLEAETISWDMRNHGNSGHTQLPSSWWEYCWDATAVLDHSPTDLPRVGVGHSMGGAVLVMAALEQPDYFEGLVLIEPVIMRSQFRRSPDHVFAQLSQRRKRRFASREDAYHNFVEKPPFSSWDPEALSGYLAGGLVETEDGEVTLACPPELETEVYTAAGLAGLSEYVDQIQIPVELVVGSASQTYPPGWMEEIVPIFPDIELASVADGSHFLPMDQPHQVLLALERIKERL